MEARTRVRKYYANLGHDSNYDEAIKAAFNDLNSSGCPIYNFPDFRTGYLAGMDNPKLEAVIKSVQILKLFKELSEQDKEAVMLMMDGLKYRNAR